MKIWEKAVKIRHNLARREKLKFESSMACDLLSFYEWEEMASAKLGNAHAEPFQPLPKNQIISQAHRVFLPN